MATELQQALQRLEQIVQAQSQQIEQLTARVHTQQQMSDAVSHAAAAAAAAAVAGMHSNTTQRQQDSNMHKYVEKPDAFLGTVGDWERFKFSLSTWSITVDPKLPENLEACSKLTEELSEVDMTEPSIALSHKLYVILVGLAKLGDVPKMAKQIRDKNGFELWRRMCQTFEPQTTNKPLAWLRILNNPKFPSEEHLWQKGFEDWESEVCLYEAETGKIFDEDNRLAILHDVCPTNLKTQMVTMQALNPGSLATYNSLRLFIVSYLKSKN